MRVKLGDEHDISVGKLKFSVCGEFDGTVAALLYRSSKVTLLFKAAFGRCIRLAVALVSLQCILGATHPFEVRQLCVYVAVRLVF